MAEGRRLSLGLGARINTFCFFNQILIKSKYASFVLVLYIINNGRVHTPRMKERVKPIYACIRSRRRRARETPPRLKTWTT